MSQTSYENLVDIVTSDKGTGTAAYQAINQASLSDLRQLTEEYDLDAIAETFPQPSDGAALATTAQIRLDKLDRNPDLFKAANGYYCDTQSRLRAVKDCADPALLEDALLIESLQKSVRTAIERRIKVLSKSGMTKSGDTAQAKPHEAAIKIADIVESDIKKLQMREDIDHTHVDELKECLSELPPITVFADEETSSQYWIGDGWHRFLAHKLTNKKEIAAIVHPGGKAAALKHALGANAEHNALRRTNRDKRKAVKIALGAYNTHSNREIAKLCRVTEGLVRLVKKELEVATVDTNSSGSGKQKPSQIDFFAQLNASFKPVEEGLKEVFNHSYFLNPDVLKKDKLEAIESIEHLLSQRLQEAKDLKTKLAAQEENQS
jgi:hypothetical protein